MFFDTFLVKALAGVEEYNTVHVHSGVSATPAQAWQRDNTPINHPPAETLHPLMLAVPRQRLVGKDGISYNGIKFLSPALAPFRRRKVEIRVLPHDVDRIWVFDPADDSFICHAIPAHRLSLAERQQLLRKRSDDYREVREALDAGAAIRAQEALVNEVLDQEERARANRTQAEPGATGSDAAATEPDDAGSDEDANGPDLGPLRADIDAYLDTFEEEA